MTAKKKDEPSATELLFSKEQLLSAKRFEGRRDLVNALLSSNQQYTAEAVEQEISNYMKGQVK